MDSGRTEASQIAVPVARPLHPMSDPHATLLSTVRKALGEESPLLQEFEGLLSRGNGAELECLLDQVDDSDYSLADWVEAFVAFDRWLAEKGETRRPLTGMRGYIHCCTFMNSPLLYSPSLKVIVIKALTEYGFDVLTEAQI